MDTLDRVTDAATDLLARVDRSLAEDGAAPGHPVWPLVRRLRALPGEAVGAVATLRHAPLAGAGTVLGPLADAYAETARTARRGVGWTGPAAARFTAAAGALATHLSGAGTPDTPGLAGRAHAMAAFAEEVAGWMVDTRRAVAHCVATALGSAQALTLRTSPAPSPETAAAAADIAALILRTVGEAYDAAEELSTRWADRLAEEPYRAAEDGPSGVGGGGPSGVVAGGDPSGAGGFTVGEPP